MIARIAVGLAWNSAPEYRWRRIAVPLAAAVFVLLTLFASSVVVMVQRAAERVEKRTALLAWEPSPQDLILHVGDDVWRGEQFAVVWIEPAGDAQPVLPPGMRRLPRPGQAVVSPALHRLASAEPALAARYQDRMILGREGVGVAGELFAYVRMPEDRSLPGALAGDLSGRTGAVRARAFGAPTGSDLVLPLEPALPMVSAVAAAQGAFGFLVVPGLMVLAAGVAAASSVREYRFEVLRWIGAPERTLARLAVLETSLLAVPGIVAAAVFWALVAPHLGWLPVVGHAASRGDLALPWWLFVPNLVAGILVTGLFAVAMTAVFRRYGEARLRPASRRSDSTLLRAAPLAAAFVAFALGGYVGGNPAAALNLGGIVATVLGVPLLLPGVLRGAGSALGRLESVPASIAGRGLQWDPVRAARPFAGGAALVVLVLAASAYVALARHAEVTSAPAAETPVVFVRWADPGQQDPDRLAKALGTGLVVPYREDGHAHEEPTPVGATCGRLSPYLPGPPCSPEAPFELPEVAERRLVEIMTEVSHGSDVHVRLVPAREVEASGAVLVFDDASLESLDERVRGAAMQTLPAPAVRSLASSGMSESPLVAWIIGGAVVAATTLAIGCLLSLVDRFLATRGHRRHLLNLGISPRQLTTLEAWLFAVPYGTVFAFSFCCGLAVCTLMTALSGVPTPWTGIWSTFVAAGVIGFAGTVGAAILGAKDVRKNRE